MPLQPTSDTSNAPTLQSLSKTDFRGATVEDLELQPALTINPETDLADALEACYENSYSYLPVVSSETRSLLGYLKGDELANQVRKGQGVAPGKKTVKDAMIRFRSQKPKHPFEVITPDTPLEELVKFFLVQGNDFAVITDANRRFVLGVAVADDLIKYAQRRPALTGNL